MISRILCLVILVIISSFPFLQLSPKVMAQTPSSEGAKVLVEDTIQDLKLNDTKKAQIQVNATSFESVKMLLDDAISALNSGDLNIFFIIIIYSSLPN